MLRQPSNCACELIVKETISSHRKWERWRKCFPGKDAQEVYSWKDEIVFDNNSKNNLLKKVLLNILKTLSLNQTTIRVTINFQIKLCDFNFHWNFNRSCFDRQTFSSSFEIKTYFFVWDLCARVENEWPQFPFFISIFNWIILNCFTINLTLFHVELFRS